MIPYLVHSPCVVKMVTYYSNNVKWREWRNIPNADGYDERGVTEWFCEYEHDVNHVLRPSQSPDLDPIKHLWENLDQIYHPSVCMTPIFPSHTDSHRHFPQLCLYRFSKVTGILVHCWEHHSQSIFPCVYKMQSWTLRPARCERHSFTLVGAWTMDIQVCKGWLVCLCCVPLKSTRLRH